MERIKMSYADRQAHAKTMSAFAKANLAEDLETWKGDQEMIDCARSDGKDYREIARLLRTVGAEAAFDMCRSLDTAAREIIPDTIWNALESDEDYREETGETEREIVVYRIRRYTDEIEALQAKLKAANEHLMRIDL